MEALPGKLIEAGITSASVLIEVGAEHFADMIAEVLGDNVPSLAPSELAEVELLRRAAVRLAGAEHRSRLDEAPTGLGDVAEVLKRRRNLPSRLSPSVG